MNFQPIHRIARRPLDRRTLLRGAGAALAIPVLESMAPPLRSELQAPKRFAALFCPNGMLPAAWVPGTEGKDYALTPTLAPIEPVRESVLVLGNLFNRASRAGEGHYVKTTAWLSGAPVKRTGGRDLRVGTSIDQHLAARVGTKTPLSSMVLGVEPVRNRVDMGYSTVYGANVSWRTPTVPAERELNPRRAFERLVRWTGTRAHGGRSRRVLDVVLKEAKGLRQSLGAYDRHKLDEYLESVHSLESRIAAFEGDGAGTEAESPALTGAPPEKPGAYPEHVQLMLETLLLAFRTDATRIATFMFGNAVSGRDFSHVEGVKGGHHGLSHHENREDKMAMYALINRWHVERFAWLLGELGKMEEGAGTVLDSSMILFGSGLADGNRHNPNDLPILVGGGVLPGGQHVRQAELTPLCNLYARVLGEFGFEGEAFGDSTGPLAGI